MRTHSSTDNSYQVKSSDDWWRFAYDIVFNFLKSSDFQKIFRFWENFHILEKHCQRHNRQCFGFSENFLIFGKKIPILGKFSDLWNIFGNFLDFQKIFRFLKKKFRFLKGFQICGKFLTLTEIWRLRHWLHFWQLRTTIWTITLWPLNREWWWQHSQFLLCFEVNTAKNYCFIYIWIQ